MSWRLENLCKADAAGKGALEAARTDWSTSTLMTAGNYPPNLAGSSLPLELIIDIKGDWAVDNGIRCTARQVRAEHSVDFTSATWQSCEGGSVIILLATSPGRSAALKIAKCHRCDA